MKHIAGELVWAIIGAAVMITLGRYGGLKMLSIYPGETQLSGEENGEDKEEGLLRERITLDENLLSGSGIETQPVVQIPFGESIAVTGVLETNPDRMALVRPRVQAQVQEVRAALGIEVKKGDVLAVLDSMNLGAAKADYLQEKGLLEGARLNYEREKSLYEERIGSQVDLLDAKSGFIVADSKFKAAREKLLLLGLDSQEIKELKWSKEGLPTRFQLLAPIDGIVIERDITTGQVIDSEDTVFTIADLSTVWVLLRVYEKDIAKCRNGQEVKLTLKAQPKKIMTGKITYVSHLVDRETRTTTVRVELDNTSGKLKPGMFVTAIIAAVSVKKKSSFAVPDAAIYRLNGVSVVFILEGEHSFRAQTVELGSRFGDFREIFSALAEGDKVVTRGGFIIKSEMAKSKIVGDDD